MKKFLILFLTVTLVFSSLSFTLVSCTDKSEKEILPSGEKPLPDGDIFAERALIDDGLPEYDFKEELFVLHHTPLVSISSMRRTEIKATL